MIIVTGASQNHFKSLDQFIHSYINTYTYSFINRNDEDIKLIVYNLGINETDWEMLQQKYDIRYDIIYKTFDYSNYPDFLNININAGGYAWKPVIIYNTCNEYESDIIIWMDAGNIILCPLNDIKIFVITHGIYSANASSCLKPWTHPNTFQILNCSEEIQMYKSKNAACMAFNHNIDWVKEFVEEFNRFSLIKDCIAPEGTTPNNHRYDQSIFSVLFYQYLEKKGFYNVLDYMGYSIHNDID